MEALSPRLGWLERSGKKGTVGLRKGDRPLFLRTLLAGAWRGLAIGLIAVGMVGCASTKSVLTLPTNKPTGVPSTVIATWNPAVVFTPDPIHRGDPTPGIAGRIFLFEPENPLPVLGKGQVVVELYQMTSRGPEGKTPVAMERWIINQETLKRLERKDAVGWGYTVFLPWGSYNPSISQVQLRLRFEPETKGTLPLYADSTPLTLNKGDITPIIASRTVKPHG